MISVGMVTVLAAESPQKQESQDSRILWLVNPNNPLEATYRPERLVLLKGYAINAEARVAYLKMLEDMRAVGIEGLKLQSAYRAYRHQQAIFNEKIKSLVKMGHTEEGARTIAARSVAVPGASEHQLGLAVDVSIDGQLSVDFAETEAGVWIKNNSARYGYIVRYPKEKTAITRIMYEPWHLRYVGVPHAEFMRENNLCFEEYIDLVKNAGIILFWLGDGRYYKISYSSSYINKTSENVESYSISSIGASPSDGYIITELKRFLS
ncbi:MAG: M15 family metallopeptidase [Defluviitaleaceae bacterium]|nr:M15 family metallopeptidase [Defluviitaleaceae bacterium]